MNQVYMQGTLRHVPRYDVIPSTSDAIVRGILDTKMGAFPILCCNELACSARNTFIKLKNKEVHLAGTLQSGYFKNSFGIYSFFPYVLVTRIAESEKELMEMEDESFTPLQYKDLPFGLQDVEEILQGAWR